MTGEAAEERGSVARSGSLPPEGSGKILTHSTADALRISDPRSASKPSAPADSEAASTSAFELITAQSYFESGLGTAIQIQFPNPVNSEACYE